LPYRSVNPATGEVITTFANHTDAELQSALSVAHWLYKSDWSKGPIQARLDVLSRPAGLLDGRFHESRHNRGIHPQLEVMAAWRRRIELALGEEDTAKLRSIARSQTEPASRVERARILLAYQRIRVFCGQPGAWTASSDR
jgi:hypothetical protein